MERSRGGIGLRKILVQLCSPGAPVEAKWGAPGGAVGDAAPWPRPSPAPQGKDQQGTAQRPSEALAVLCFLRLVDGFVSAEPEVL